MAEKKLRLEVVTPDRLVLSTDADVVVCPGVEGQFGVLVGHIPFLSALDIGEMYYRLGGKTEYLTVLAAALPKLPAVRSPSWPKPPSCRCDIDMERARRAKERAERRLAAAKTEEIDYVRAEVAMRRALVRVKVASR